MQSFGFKRVGLISVALLSLCASPAHANAGLPMIAVMWPLMMLALLPIVAIETYVICTRLALSVWHAATVTAVANAFSTIIGIPITWFLLLFAPVIQRSAWLLPHQEEYEGQNDWVATTSALALLVPFLFASWLIECRIAVGMMPWLDAGRVSAAFFAGNVITYGCLAAFILGVSIWAIRREHGTPVERSSANIDALRQDYDEGLAPVLDESSV